MTFHIEFGPEAARICEMFVDALFVFVHAFSVYVVVVAVDVARRFFREVRNERV